MDSIIRPDMRLFLICFTFLVFVLNTKFPWIHLEWLIKVRNLRMCHVSIFWNIKVEKPIAKNSWLLENLPQIKPSTTWVPSMCPTLPRQRSALAFSKSTSKHVGINIEKIRCWLVLLTAVRNIKQGRVMEWLVSYSSPPASAFQVLELHACTTVVTFI